MRTFNASAAALCFVALTACRSASSSSATAQADANPTPLPGTSSQTASDTTPAPGISSETLPNEPAPSAAVGELRAPRNADPPADGERTASGLVSQVQKLGTGKDRIAENDFAWVTYIEWDARGKKSSSSSDATAATLWKPSSLKLKGLEEGLKLMRRGEKRRFWLPAALARGVATKQDTASKRKGEGSKGSLVYDVEVLEVFPDPKVLAPALKKAGVHAYQRKLPYEGGVSFPRSLIMEPAGECEEKIDFKIVHIELERGTMALSALREILLEADSKVCVGGVRFTAQGKRGAFVVYGPVTADYRPLASEKNLKVYPDGWGARDVTLKPSKAAPLLFAGLRFADEVVLGVSRDGVVMADREGVVGRDQSGQVWSARSVSIEGDPAIVFTR